MWVTDKAGISDVFLTPPYLNSVLRLH